MPAIKEDQLGVLRDSGILQREVSGWTPQEAAARVERATPFLSQLGADTGLVRGGQEDRKRHAQVMAMWKKLERVGVVAVTVVNCMPWPVEVMCGVHRHFIKRADWAKNEMHHIRTFGMRDIRIDADDMGDGKYGITPLLPVEIADEFMRKYVGVKGELEEDENGQIINNKPGGLFVYAGGENDVKPDEFTEYYRDAMDRLEVWFWSQYKIGEAAWERYKHDPLHIQNTMKQAATYLHSRGKIATLPGWVTASKAESGVKECPACAETIKKAAKVCRFCGSDIAEDGGFTRGNARAPLAASVPDAEPEPSKPTSMTDPSVLASLEPDLLAGKSDREILDTPLDQLPDPKPAKPMKPRPKKEE